MSRFIKEIIVKELKQQFENVSECVVVSIRGIDGNDNNALRGDLLQKDIKLTVVKNSLVRRAFRDLGMEMINSYIEGPSAIVYGGESIVDVVKVLVEWDKKVENFHIKAGYLEGRGLDEQATKNLAKLPSRSELQGTVVMLANSPGRNLAGCIISPAAVIAGCIKTLINNQEEAA